MASMEYPSVLIGGEVRTVEFERKWYFVLSDVIEHVGQATSEEEVTHHRELVEQIRPVLEASTLFLPVPSLEEKMRQEECIDAYGVEAIRRALMPSDDQLSDYNQKLKQMLDFKPGKKK